MTISINDFYAYLPKHKYLFIPTGDLWPASSVNARLAIVVEHNDASQVTSRLTPTEWLDRNRAVVSLQQAQAITGNRKPLTSIRQRHLPSRQRGCR